MNKTWQRWVYCLIWNNIYKVYYFLSNLFFRYIEEPILCIKEAFLVWYYCVFYVKESDSLLHKDFFDFLNVGLSNSWEYEWGKEPGFALIQYLYKNSECKYGQE